MFVYIPHSLYSWYNPFGFHFHIRFALMFLQDLLEMVAYGRIIFRSIWQSIPARVVCHFRVFHNMHLNIRHRKHILNLPDKLLCAFPKPFFCQHVFSGHSDTRLFCKMINIKQYTYELCSFKVMYKKLLLCYM